ncbi:MAG TPA: anthrone oxygenase family protein [Pseudonocardiaceae bacterium]|nr:anthrone oxygenase family protein [Pseudonocardiaceae bacterium]
MRVVLEFVNLFCVGILAGTEFVVRLGVRAPITVLAEQPQIQLRQALIRRLRVVVPAVFGATVLSTVAVTVADGTGAVRLVGIAAVVAWTLVTFTGTVPINKATLTWRPDAPPHDWRVLVRRWERLDTARAVAATTAFAFFLTAVAVRH